MPNYEYRCDSCGYQFERLQTMQEPALNGCPSCGGAVHRLVTGGAGFIFKHPSPNRPAQSAKECSLERAGVTCCGRNQRCDKPACGDDE